MWSKKFARQLKEAKTQWLGSTKANRSLEQKAMARSRFLCPQFIAWARDSDIHPNMINAFEQQYLKSFQATPAKKVHAFVDNLLSNKMCELCSAFAPATATTRICGVCRNTEEGAAYAINKAIALGKERWRVDKRQLLEKQKATCQKRYGTDFPWQNPEVNRVLLKKKAATMLQRYGFDHHLKSPDIFFKQQLACGRIKQLKKGGRVYLYQGYEDFAIRRLVKRYGAENVVSQFDSDFPDTGVGYLPDLYLKNLGFYVEVKSDYTLLRMLDQNKDKAKRCAEADIKVAWFVVYKREKQAIRLPGEWYTWSAKKITSFLESQAPSHP